MSQYIQGSVHTKRVAEAFATDKVFSTRQGEKRKWMIKFEDGFTAENVLPNREGEVSLFTVGKLCDFRIGFVSDKGIEIDYRGAADPGNVNQRPLGIAKPYPPEVRPNYLAANIYGSPIAIALQTSVAMGNASTEDVTKDAEDILKWILGKLQSDQIG